MCYKCKNPTIIIKKGRKRQEQGKKEEEEAEEAQVTTSTLKPDISLKTFAADNKEETGKIHNLHVQ